MKHRAFHLTVIAVLLTFIACSFAHGGEDPRGSIARIQRTKKLTLNIQASGEPYIFRDKNGLPTGFTVDLQKMLAKDFDADLYVTDVDFSGVIPAMLARKTDFLAFHLSYTIERAKVLMFTEPYWNLDLVAFIQQKDAEKYGDWRNLNAADVKVGVQAGTVAEAVARNMFYKAEIVVYGSDVDCLLALNDKLLDCHINNEGLWNMVQANYKGNIIIARDYENGTVSFDKMAFATRPDDPYANYFLNFWLKAKKDNGNMAALVDYWFSDDSPYQDDYKTKAAKGQLSKDRQVLVELIGTVDYEKYIGDDKYRVFEQ